MLRCLAVALIAVALAGGDAVSSRASAAPPLPMQAAPDTTGRSTAPDSTDPDSTDPDSAAPDPADPDTSTHPNEVPYRTDRSVAYHVLAFPAYVLDAATWPLGVTVRYLENNFPSLFIPKPVEKGILPLVELGGPNGVEVGAALFHRDLWNDGHRARLSGEIAARESWDAELEYDVPSPVGAGSGLTVFGEYAVNSRRRFFVGGNSSDRNLDEAQYYRRHVDARAILDLGLGPGYAAETQVQYQHVRTRASDEDLTLGRRIRGQNGLGVLDLASVRAEATADFTRSTVHAGAHRRYAGTVLIGRVGYAHQLNGARFRYASFMAEVQQFVPLPVLPESRRLAVRARVEKVEPIFGGDAVPFYDLPNLGGQESIRGFVHDRFVDDGFLLLNAEYRYPIWDTFDAVVFVDAGQVFNGFSDLAADRFQWSYGGGVRALAGRQLGGRLEAAYSDEGWRVILTVTPVFGARPAGD